jgi:voltage-gated potassium channel
MEATARRLERERSGLLYQLERALEGPLVALALAWLALLVVDLTRGLGPTLTRVSLAVWAVFAADFLLKLGLAPRKLAYLKRNWLAALSLALPALRLARIGRLLRVLRIGRGVRMVRLMASLNRGLRSLRVLMRRRRLGFVLAVTVMVALTGAAGMVAFERGGTHDSFASYPSALWWTAMILTTMGSEAWPRSAEGRLLCLALSVYSFTTFGYVTASLASYFVGQDERARGGRRRSPGPSSDRTG